LPVHHLDIAPNNLLQANGKGLLIDLDFTSVEESYSSTLQQSDALPRTGHKAYMSISELTALVEGNRNKEYAIRDDIESLFYCVLLEVTKGKSHASLKGWSLRPGSDLLAIKKDFARSPVIFRARLDISIKDFYRPLIDALMAWYEALFLFQLEGPELVSAVKDILENAETTNFGCKARRGAYG
jgi:hypothetical protein